jgi:hypothetical protein
MQSQSKPPFLQLGNFSSKALFVHSYRPGRQGPRGRLRQTFEYYGVRPDARSHRHKLPVADYHLKHASWCKHASHNKCTCKLENPSPPSNALVQVGGSIAAIRNMIQFAAIANEFHAEGLTFMVKECLRFETKESLQGASKLLTGATPDRRVGFEDESIDGIPDGGVEHRKQQEVKLPPLVPSQEEEEKDFGIQFYSLEICDTTRHPTLQLERNMKVFYDMGGLTDESWNKPKHSYLKRKSNAFNYRSTPKEQTPIRYLDRPLFAPQHMFSPNAKALRPKPQNSTAGTPEFDYDLFNGLRLKDPFPENPEEHESHVPM